MVRKSLVVFGCIFCINSIALFSQDYQQIKDSMYELSTVDKVKLLLNHAKKKQDQLDSSLFYTEKAITILKDVENDSLQAKARYYKAYLLYFLTRYDEAKTPAQKTIDFAEKTKNNHLITEAYTILYSAHKMKNELDSSLYYNKKLLDFSLSLNDSLLIGKAYNAVGDGYLTIKEEIKAREYFTTSLQYYTMCNAPKTKMFLPYYNLLRIAKNTKEADSLFIKAKETLIEDKTILNILALQEQRAETYLRLEKGKQALNFIVEYEKLVVKHNLLSVFNSRIYQNYGNAYLLLQEDKKAIEYFEKALEAKGDKNTVANILEQLQKLYEKQKQFKKGYYTTKRINHIKDSLYKKISAKEYAQFYTKYKLAEKDKQIFKQELTILKESENKKLWITGSVFGFVLLLFLFQYYSFFQRRKKITIQKELEKVKEIEQMRVDFLGNISHEIKTPLTLISGNITLALEQKTENKALKKQLKKALKNTKKVITDFNQVLELLKTNKIQHKVVNSSIKINPFCKKTFLAFESLTFSKRINLHYHSNISNDVLIETDSNKLEKIINNLVSNAIKYSKANSKINFYLTQKSNFIKIEVEDFGLGIPSNEQDKVFNRFYQAKNSKKIGGIGIGLALSKEFTELLKGNLTFESKLNKGSKFILTIPFVKGQEQTSEKFLRSKSEHLKLTKEENKPTVLIVEDNIEMSDFLVEILKLDYNCLTAFDGQEAIEKLKTSKVDLITSDVMMPNVDGFNFKEALNELDDYKHIPFIFISAKSLEEDIIKGFKMGIQDYITKPFNKNQLLARVHNLIQNKKTRETWRVKNTELLTENRNSFDKELIDKIEKIVIKNITNEGFKIEDLASEVGYSQRQLTRYLKEFTGMSPVKFILEIRLQKAYSLLKNNVFPTIKEVKYEVGIASSPYFNKKFKERFGILPKNIT